jgi:hypothetical protein
MKRDDATLMITSPLSAQERQVVETFLGNGNLSTESTATLLDLPRDAVRSILREHHVSQAMALSLLATDKDRVTQLRDSALTALWHLANWDPKDAFGPDGLLLRVYEMPVEIRRAIRGFKMGRYGLELQFVDKAAIMMYLAKHLTALSQAADSAGEEKTVLEVYPTEEDG